MFAWVCDHRVTGLHAQRRLMSARPTTIEDAIASDTLLVVAQVVHVRHGSMLVRDFCWRSVASSRLSLSRMHAGTLIIKFLSAMPGDVTRLPGLVHWVKPRTVVWSSLKIDRSVDPIWCLFCGQIHVSARKLLMK